MKRSRRGNTLVEFALVGIPLIFMLISIFEIARGMWLYHTLAYAITEGGRYASVHGRNCKVEPNACTVSVGQVARHIQRAGVGLPAEEVTLRLTSASGTISCRMADCLSNPAIWPPTPGDTPGQTIEVAGTYPFRSAIAMFWPGAADVRTLPTIMLPASTVERIQF